MKDKIKVDFPVNKTAIADAIFWHLYLNGGTARVTKRAARAYLVRAYRHEGLGLEEWVNDVLDDCDRATTAQHKEAQRIATKLFPELN